MLYISCFWLVYISCRIEEQDLSVCNWHWWQKVVLGHAKRQEMDAVWAGFRSSSPAWVPWIWVGKANRRVCHQNSILRGKCHPICLHTKLVDYSWTSVQSYFYYMLDRQGITALVCTHVYTELLLPSDRISLSLYAPAIAQSCHASTMSSRPKCLDITLTSLPISCYIFQQSIPLDLKSWFKINSVNIAIIRISWSSADPAAFWQLSTESDA